MSLIPAHLAEFLGTVPRLGLLRPSVEAKGPLIDKICKAPDSALSGGKSVKDAGALKLVRGGLLYAVDAIHAAHAIFQNNYSPLGSYWHGMMHRREGDFSNACYWFRRAGELPVLQAINGFDPESFTMRCSRANGDPEDLVEEQRREWEALMAHCYQAAVGA